MWGLEAAVVEARFAFALLSFPMWTRGWVLTPEKMWTPEPHTRYQLPIFQGTVAIIEAGGGGGTKEYTEDEDLPVRYRVYKGSKKDRSKENVPQTAQTKPATKPAGSPDPHSNSGSYGLSPSPEAKKGIHLPLDRANLGSGRAGSGRAGSGKMGSGKVDTGRSFSTAASQRSVTDRPTPVSTGFKLDDKGTANPKPGTLEELTARLCSAR